MINKNLIDEYCISNSATESELLKKIRQDTYKNEDLADMIFTIASINSRTTVETVVMKPTLKRDLSDDLNAAKNKTE